MNGASDASIGIARRRPLPSVERKRKGPACRRPFASFALAV